MDVDAVEREEEVRVSLDGLEMMTEQSVCNSPLLSSWCLLKH